MSEQLCLAVGTRRGRWVWSVMYGWRLVLVEEVPVNRHLLEVHIHQAHNPVFLPEQKPIARLYKVLQNLDVAQGYVQRFGTTAPAFRSHEPHAPRFARVPHILGAIFAFGAHGTTPTHSISTTTQTIARRLKSSPLVPIIHAPTHPILPISTQPTLSNCPQIIPSTPTLRHYSPSLISLHPHM